MHPLTVICISNNSYIITHRKLNLSFITQMSKIWKEKCRLFLLVVQNYFGPVQKKGSEIKLLYMSQKSKFSSDNSILALFKIIWTGSKNCQNDTLKPMHPSITDGVHRNENLVEIIPVFSTFLNFFKKKNYKSHFM